MISNKEQLKYFIQQDCERNLKAKNATFRNYRLRLLLGGDDAMAFHYLKTLRKYEYSINVLPNNLFGKLVRAYYKYRHKHLSIKYNIVIGPNKIGPGFRMPHVIGGGIVINCRSMGSNCSANLGVLIGNKGCQENRPTIGNNVSFAPGSKAIGKINIGNNVVVAPNSVVIKDVPDNCIVSGVPAIIIKRKEE